MRNPISRREGEGMDMPQRWGPDRGPARRKCLFRALRILPLGIQFSALELLSTNSAMLLVIDNYDSFTYNLVQYFGELGAEMLVRRNDEITLDEIARLQPERIVISPGPCTPNEAGV